MTILALEGFLPAWRWDINYLVTESSIKPLLGSTARQYSNQSNNVEDEDIPAMNIQTVPAMNIQAVHDINIQVVPDINTQAPPVNILLRLKRNENLEWHVIDKQPAAMLTTRKSTRTKRLNDVNKDINIQASTVKIILRLKRNKNLEWHVIDKQPAAMLTKRKSSRTKRTATKKAI